MYGRRHSNPFFQKCKHQELKDSSVSQWFDIVFSSFEIEWIFPNYFSWTIANFAKPFWVSHPPASRHEKKSPSKKKMCHKKRSPQSFIKVMAFISCRSVWRRSGKKICCLFRRLKNLKKNDSNYLKARQCWLCDFSWLRFLYEFLGRRTLQNRSLSDTTLRCTLYC